MDNQTQSAGQERHVFIVGAKSVGQYGGFESFVAELLACHRDHPVLRYHVTVKARGSGAMDESGLAGVTPLDSRTFLWNGARIRKLSVPPLGPAQAVALDINGLRQAVRFCRENRMKQPVFYLLACRIGPFLGPLVRAVHRLGGTLYVNPDGQEYLRAKWPAPVRAYWRLSERLTVRRADVLVCDSRRIEANLLETYKRYAPKTVFIPYGAHLTPSPLSGGDPAFAGWMADNGLTPGGYYMCCARLVPENSFETMIREFMASGARRPLVLITTGDKSTMDSLRKSTGFEKDPRIRFVPPVYRRELLRKIRENAYANLHGHTVGGTNPTLLEALAATKLNLLVDVSYNREAAGDAALYWTREPGSLRGLIDRVDRPETFPEERREEYGRKARERIKAEYSWDKIARQYEQLWTSGAAPQSQSGRPEGK